MSYWDTSALAKLYVTEADSSTFDAYYTSSEPVTVSAIGRYELRAVLRRREAEGTLSQGATGTFHRTFLTSISEGRITQQEITRLVETEFENLLDSCLAQDPPIFIRTNDALHLAAARVAGETTVITVDKRLRAAALFLGFTVLPAP